MEVSVTSPSESHRRWCHNGSAVALAVLLISATLAGCSDEDEPRGPGPLGPVGPFGDETGIPGSGNIVNEVLDVGEFAEIVFASEGTVIVTRSEDASLAIEADDNLQQYLDATVIGDVLRVSTADGADIAPSEPPAFRIGVADLTAIELAGVGTIDVDGLETPLLHVTLSGVGGVTIDPVTVDELVLDLHGAGTVSLRGSADQLRATIAGAADLAAADLASATATIDATDSGKAVVWVSNELDVAAFDAASVEYYGTPSVTVEVSGAASVVRLGAK